MSKVHIFIGNLSEEEVVELVLLLEAAGVPAEEVVLVSDVPPPEEDSIADIFIFVLTPETIASPAAQEAISKVPNGGRRAICVWPKDAPPDAVPPPAAQKFSYSTVSWDPKHLSSVIKGDTSSFEKPTGERTEPPETDRNECDD